MLAPYWRRACSMPGRLAHQSLPYDEKWLAENPVRPGTGGFRASFPAPGDGKSGWLHSSTGLEFCSPA